MYLVVAHYVVPTQSWAKLKRREVVSAFDKPKLSRRAVPQSATNTNSCKSEVEVYLLLQKIRSIPLVTLTAMWSKASELLSAQNAITPAPGDDLKARIVISRGTTPCLQWPLFV